MFFSIGSVCATDDASLSLDNTALSSLDNSSLDSNNNDVISLSANNDDIISLGADDTQDFNELYLLIRSSEPGSTIELLDNYEFVSRHKSGIIIDRSITINGNGHFIDGKNKTTLFRLSSGQGNRHTIIFNNLIFINGFAEGNYGGAFNGVSDSLCKLLVFNDCTFINCSASYGGSVIRYHDGNVVLNNCVFINNSIIGDIYIEPQYGGAILCDGNVTAINCIFINNNGYSGGVINCYNATIESSTFINNSAIWGGAISSLFCSIRNSTFSDNDAINGGGAIFTAIADINNSTFTNNSATIGNSLLILDTLNLNNTNILESDIKNYDSINQHFSSDYWNYYCTECYVPQGGNNGYFINETLVLNLTGDDVSDYLKILVYYYYDSDNLGNLITIFSDFVFNDYVISSDEDDTTKAIKDVVAKYNSGLRIPDSGAIRVLDNGKTLKFKFTSALHPIEQNRFLFNITCINPNISVYKETINKTVYVGEQTEFKIIVKNTGDIELNGIYVYEDSFDDLIFNSWKSDTGIWNYSFVNNKHKWVLMDQLNCNETASFIVIFNTTSPGVKINKVIAGSNITNETNSTNTTEVIGIHPNISVYKETLNKTVYVGEQTEFRIVVKNTGDINLTNVYIIEKSFDDLIFNSWTKEKGNWVYTLENCSHKWTLNSLNLNETASFIVVFNTTTVGNKTNIILCGSDKTNVTEVNNVTEVIDKEKPIPKDNITNNTTKNISPKSIMINTGNPLLILILSLFALVLGGFKRKF